MRDRSGVLLAYFCFYSLASSAAMRASCAAMLASSCLSVDDMPQTSRPSTHLNLLNEITLLSYDWIWPWTPYDLKTSLAPALAHSVPLLTAL